MKRCIIFFAMLMVVLFLIPSSAIAWQVLEKASPDECFYGIGDSNNLYPFDPAAVSCGGQEKRNEAYVWGLTQFGDNIFFGTGANIHCLVIRGYLGQDDPLINEDYVCEASANDPVGDWRPPSLYMYNDTRGLVKLFELNTPLNTSPAVYSAAAMRKFYCSGIRSAGAHPGGVVFLAGPSMDPRGISLFAFDGNTGQLLGSETREDYSNIRKWAVGSDENLYVGFGGGEGGVGGGAIWKWTGDPVAILGGDTATLFDFEMVGEGLDGDAAEITEHNNRLYVNTWPGGLSASGLWMSPQLPLTDSDSGEWKKVWSSDRYDPDPVTARTYGGGAVASFDGWVYWGTMHVPGTAALAHAQVYGEPTDNNSQTDLLLNTWRAISIFRGQGFETGNPRIQLLYGGSLNNNPAGYFPAYNGARQTWEVRRNLMGLTPLYGRGGFNNQFNNYCWTMRVYHGELYVGTMDHSYLVNDLFENQNLLSFFYIWIYFGSYDYGADLFKFSSASNNAQAVSRNGMGNIMNYGIRTMITDNSDLYLGTANPMNLNPNGGWELIRLNTSITRVPDVTGMTQAGAQMMIAKADLNCDIPNITYVCSGIVDGDTVISQNPSRGRRVLPGTTVFLTVASDSCPEIPACIGQEQTAAEAAIDAVEGLSVGTVLQQCSDTFAEGLVIEQTPAAGQMFTPGTVVDLVVSSGNCPIVPDCGGLSEADATAALTNEGLVKGTVTEKCSDTVTEGLVIEQTPAAGLTVDPGTAVDLVISSGDCLQVPDCLSQTQEDAEAAIESEGLRVGTVTETCSEIDAGLVIEQSPAAGLTVDPGTAVDLVVSSGDCQNLRGDLDGDGQVCSRDIDIIRQSMWRRVAFDDPRNIDRDGFVTFFDYLAIIGLCTNSGCRCQ